jgi:hypothetical protein
MAVTNDPNFDPYHKWLGIPKHLRPPTYYQLLGLSQGESDPEVIEEAAVRQSTHLRSYQIGPQAELCTRLLNEIGRAQQVLLNPQKKREYDQRLSQNAKQAEAASAGGQFATKPMVPVVAPVVAPAAANPFEAFAVEPATPRKPAARKAPRDDNGRRSIQKDAEPQGSRSMVPMVAAIGGGVAALSMGLGVIAWFALSSAPDEAHIAEHHQIAEVKEKQPDPAPEPPKIDRVRPQPPIVKPKPVELPFVPEGNARPLRRISAHPMQTAMRTIVPLKDGRVVVGVPPALQVFDPTAGVSKGTIKVDRHEPIGAAHPDGESVVFAAFNEPGAARIKVATGEVVSRFTSADAPASVIVSPDGKLVAIGDNGGGVKAYDAATGAERNTIKTRHAGPVDALAFNQRGDLLTLGGGLLQLWNPQNNNLFRAERLPARLFPRLAFSPDGGRVFAASTEGLHAAAMPPATGA